MSEPVKLGDVIPGVYRDIIRRCERNPNNAHFKPEYRNGVLTATRDFFAGRKTAKPNKRQGQTIKQKALF